VIEEVEAAEDLGTIVALKKLQGYQIYYRVRVGDYRLGLMVVNEEI
jgi:mRNA interferase RelE/StbE